MTIPFRLLREALTQLSLSPQAQRAALAGFDVLHELVDDLDHALLSLRYECDRTGITLDGNLVTALRALLDSLTAPADDSLWEEQSLDTHPTWVAARRTATHLLTRLPDTAGQSQDAPSGDRG